MQNKHFVIIHTWVLPKTVGGLSLASEGIVSLWVYIDLISRITYKGGDANEYFWLTERAKFWLGLLQCRICIRQRWTHKKITAPRPNKAVIFSNWLIGDRPSIGSTLSNCYISTQFSICQFFHESYIMYILAYSFSLKATKSPIAATIGDFVVLTDYSLLFAYTYISICIR